LPEVSGRPSNWLTRSVRTVPDSVVENRLVSMKNPLNSDGENIQSELPRKFVKLPTG
jgi:hypothetical protein